MTDHLVAGMPWPARCRYCDLVTEDPDAHFWSPDGDEDTLPESYRCLASPSGLHEPARRTGEGVVQVALYHDDIASARGGGGGGGSGHVTVKLETDR